MRPVKFLLSFLTFLKVIFRQREMIRLMGIRTIKIQYSGTLLGIFWTLINPLAITLVYWFIFSIGFKVKITGDIPFVVVFFCGFIPWTTFNETLMANTYVLSRNSHLVKKTIFPTEILPVVNLVSNGITHGILLVILGVVMHFNDIPFSIYNIQFIYYLFALSIFSMGLGWMFSALNVFYRDVGQVLSVALNIWFWLTPVVWTADMIPEKYRIFLQLNPMFYIVEGYKASFVFHTPFWENVYSGIYFWTLVTTIFISGALLYRKMKPEFAEVL